MPYTSFTSTHVQDQVGPLGLGSLPSSGPSMEPVRIAGPFSRHHPIGAVDIATDGLPAISASCISHFSSSSGVG